MGGEHSCLLVTRSLCFDSRPTSSNSFALPVLKEIEIVWLRVWGFDFLPCDEHESRFEFVIRSGRNLAEPPAASELDARRDVHLTEPNGHSLPPHPGQSDRYISSIDDLWKNSGPMFMRVAINLAEREGFEPPIPVKVCRFSRPVPSTARPPLQLLLFYYSRQTVPLEGEPDHLFPIEYKRSRLQYSGFQDRPFQPLTHPSGL